jgi:hypothetical protein
MFFFSATLVKEAPVRYLKIEQKNTNVAMTPLMGLKKLYEHLITVLILLNEQRITDF